MCGRSITLSAAVATALASITEEREASRAHVAEYRQRAIDNGLDAKSPEFFAATDRASKARGASLDYDFNERVRVLNGAFGEEAAEELAGIINEDREAKEAFQRGLAEQVAIRLTAALGDESVTTH